MEPEVTNAIGLVVADDPQVRRFLADTLRRGGIRILEARSALDALKTAALSPPDFIVTDVGLADLDGVELCRRLRQLAGTAQIPIIAVSGTAPTPGDQPSTAGCDAILPKPCSPALLVATIRRLLERTPGSMRTQ
jgi:CheY-like chemotaxis protein